jgi:hypothetical protein
MLIRETVNWKVFYKVLASIVKCLTVEEIEHMDHDAWVAEVDNR